MRTTRTNAVAFTWSRAVNLLIALALVLTPAWSGAAALAKTHPHRHRHRAKAHRRRHAAKHRRHSHRRHRAKAHAAAAGFDGFGVGSFPSASWRPYANSSPLNQLVTSASVHPNSAAMVKAALEWGNPANMVDAAGATNDWAHPTYYAQPTDPVFTLKALSTPNSTSGLKIRIPDRARPAGGGDGHMTVVEPDGWEYDFWQVKSKPSGGGTMTYTGGGRTLVTGDGLHSGATAALFGNLAGVIRAPELAAGHINHALFMVLKCASTSTSFGFGTTRGASSAFVYPAFHGGAGCSNSNLPPLGARFRLAMSDAQIAALSVPGWKKTILTALAHYGGYVGDTGGAGIGFMLEDSTMYTSLGVSDPLAAFARANGVPTFNGQYVFNMSGGVDWARFLQVVVPPAH